MSLKKNLSLIYLVHFSRAAVFLLLLPLLIRRLDEGWGQVAIVLSFIQLSATVLEFGFGVSATKSVAKNKKNLSWLYQTVMSVVTIQLTLFLVVSLIGIPLIYFPVVQQLDYYLMIVFVVLFQGLSPLWFLRGVEDLRLISISEVISKLLVLVLVFLLVNGADDVGYVYLSYLLGALIPVVVSYIYIFKRYLPSARPNITIDNITNKAKEASIFFGVRVSSMFVSVGGSLILGAMGHIKLAGIYAIAERILSGIRNLLAPAWDVLFPKLISILVTDDNKADAFRKKVTLLMIAFSLTISAFLFILAPYLVQYFSGGKDEATILLVQIMCLGPFFMTVTNSLGLNYLVSNDKDSSFLISFILGSMTYLILVNYLISVSGSIIDLEKIAFSYAVSLAVTMFMVIYYVKVKYSKN